MLLDKIGPMPRLRLYTTPSCYAQIAGELLTGRARSGEDIAKLEATISERLGVRHAIAMPMARVGIYATIKSLVEPGQKVILSPYTIADVVNMVVCAGGIPVFADIDRANCNIDPESVAALIDEDTGAVLATHFYGTSCDVEAIAEICNRHGVPLVEDAAQAFGAVINGRPTGTFGKAGIFSFGMYKNVNAFFGGMVVTDDEELAGDLRQTIASWPDQPLVGYAKKVVSGLITDTVLHPLLFRTFFFRFFRWAFLNDIDAINNNLKIDVAPELKRELPQDYRIRMTPLQARLILRQLDSVDMTTQKRIRAAEQWHEGLKDIDELILPPLRRDGSCVYWYFPIQYERRHELVAHALRHGRDITESYHRNCADLACFSEFARDCPNARATAASVIYLPTYPKYGAREIARTIEVIRAYFNK